MDPKKQELNPELKQIYDRVMNTQAARPQQPAPSAQPQPGTPTVPSQTLTPPIVTPPQPVPSGGAVPAPQNVPGQSVTPQPIVPNSGSFVFTGNKVIAPKNDGKAQPAAGAQKFAAKKGFSGKLITVGLVLLIVVWGVVWAKIFGLF